MIADTIQRFAWAAALSVGLISTGCSSTASFRQLRPARVDPSFHRLAVVNVPGQRESAAEAGAVVWGRLQESGRYQLVSLEQLQQAGRAPILHQDRTLNSAALLEAAGRAGVDGILTTQVRFVEADGSLYGTKSFRIGDPRIVAELKYELIDARSGTVIARSRVQSDSYIVESDMGGVFGSEDRVMSEAARQIGQRAAEELLPHEAVVEVELAYQMVGSGAGDVRSGIAAAEDGDWQLARRHFSAAVEADANNHAAHYNLGVACEATGDLRLARRAYESALSLQPEDDYRQALDRLQRAEPEILLARAQQFPPTGPVRLDTGRRPESRPASSFFPPPPHPAGTLPPRAPQVSSPGSTRYY
jgi:tetratricopeptide (TPR) repeat protein